MIHQLIEAINNRDRSALKKVIVAPTTAAAAVQVADDDSDDNMQQQQQREVCVAVAAVVVATALVKLMHTLSARYTERSQQQQSRQFYKKISS